MMRGHEIRGPHNHKRLLVETIQIILKGYYEYAVD